MALVQQAIKILQEAAGKADPSTDLGQSILKAVQSLGKHAPPAQAAAGQGVEMQALRNIMQQARQQAPLAALQRMQPPPTPPGAGGGAPSPMPGGE